jgi:tetratricopeptide (TPR) repeat protein
VLSIQADPRSPERGQYGFMQDLLKRVAYETLPRRERKARHLAVATYLLESWGEAEHEVVEVVASHYVDAFDADPTAADSSTIKANARDMLARAGERAASLAASEEAQRYFEQAAGLAAEPADRAPLVERAGEMATLAGQSEEAKIHLEQAVTLFGEAGELHPAARASARLARVLWLRGEMEEARALAERAFTALSGHEPDEHLAAIAAELARLQYFAGENEQALERIELALEIAEGLFLPETISQALVTKALIVSARPEESEGLFRHALHLALQHDLSAAALRAQLNLAEDLKDRDRIDEAIAEIRDALVLARMRGDRGGEVWALGQLGEPLCLAGEWDETLANLAELRGVESGIARYATFIVLSPIVRILTSRGQVDEAGRFLASVEPGPADMQERAIHALGTAIVRRAQGSHDEAVRAGVEAASHGRRASLRWIAAEGFVEAAEAALELGDVATVEELLAGLDELRPVERTQSLQAHQERFRARLAERAGDSARAESSLKRAGASFRELGMPFWLAVSLLELSESLARQRRESEAQPLLDEAREIFTRLAATPWLERAERATVQAAVA